MPSKKKPSKKRKASPPKGAVSRIWSKIWRDRDWYEKVIIAIFVAVGIFVAGSYGLAYWYQQKHANEPQQVGTTFIPRYAKYFGLDPKQTLHDTLYDLGIKRLRLVSYWKDIEKTPGTYDFSELDWQFKMAEEAGATVNLSVGLRQPRWPECHEPEWVKTEPKEVWYPQLQRFMTAVVERYKDSPALVSYQVENEYFMEVFGECTDFDRQRLIEEVNLVKKLDPTKPIVVTRSNNWGGFPVGEPTPDIYGVAVYKRVYDYSVTHRYFEYPYPPWFYASLAGAGELVSGKPLIIHELQMEPWMPDGYEINKLSDIPEQNKSMNAKRLKERFEYGRETGLRTMDTWGVEWWYWRKVKANDPSLWNVAKEEVAKTNNQ